MRFKFQARDNAGQSVAGVLTANDLADASRLLRRDGKTIVALAPEGRQQIKAKARCAGGKMKVKKDDVIFFCSQLAVMVDTGVPLSDSLDSIVQGSSPGGMRDVICDISEQVKGGSDFSGALEKHPRVFNKLFVAMVRASEASGMLGTMLQRVSEYLEQDRDVRKRVKGAMIYPACMLGFCVLVVTALLVFVLPRFEKIYAGKGAVLPLPTRILLGASNGLVNYWPVVVVGLAGIGCGIYYLQKTPRGQLALDDIRLKLPVIGPMIRKACMARSLRTLATMINTGVSMLDALNLTAEVAGNHYFSLMWRQTAGKVEEGASLTDELQNAPLMPQPITQMIAAGERTGQLGTVMNRAAGFCESELKVSIKTVTDMMEPIMIIVMGLIVGGVAISLLLPIFSMSKIMAH
ncbi:MAG: type II secretion system F family protein [Phycisphaerae bacterium]|jgi:type IV pilus assembly protein PilC